MSQALRKAAILVSCLDVPTADALLEQMDERQAQRVRQAVMSLGPVDTQEEDAVIASFLRIELPDEDTPTTQAERRAASAYQPPRRAPAPTSRFEFLRETPDEKLASLLVGEHPQTIALVISHLPSQRSAAVLATLSGAEQAEVLRRLVELEAADPHALAEVESSLQARYSQQLPRERQRAAGLMAVEGIVRSADPQVQRDLLANLARYDRQLAERLTSAPPEPAPAVPAKLDAGVQVDSTLTQAAQLVPAPIALEQLDSRSLRQTAEMIDREVLILALAGMSPRLADRVLEQLSAADRQQLRRAVESLGPTRLTDLEEARHRMELLAGQLAAANRYEIPSLTNHI